LAVGPTELQGSDALAQIIFYASNIVGAAPMANVVTVTWSSEVDSPDVRIAEYRGLDPTTPFDGGTGRTGDGTSAQSGPAATARFAHELLFAAGVVGGNDGVFIDAGAGFRVRRISSEGAIAEDRVVEAIGTYAADAPVEPGANWLMQLAAFH